MRNLAQPQDRMGTVGKREINVAERSEGRCCGRCAEFFLSPTRHFLGFFLLLSLLPYALASSATKPSKHPLPGRSQRKNIILVTLDTTRADRMGFLGSNRGLTPNLDTVASRAVIFTRAYAQVPLTTPSHAVLLTGTYPQFNHVRTLGTNLADDLPDMPELLHEHGYHTAAFIGAMILDPRNRMALGFNRGFEVYDGNFHTRKTGESRYGSEERRAGDVLASALKWLRRRKPGPFFMWLHFYDPHDPYDPPSPFKEKYASAPYDGEIAYTDSVLGEFFKALRDQDLYDSSLIAIAADHGEAFGEHGEERHGVLLYDETIHVPLLMKMPSEEFAGVKIDSRVGLVDVGPTLLQAASIDVPSAMQGKTLLPLIQGGGEGKQAPAHEKDRAVYSESDYAHENLGWSELHAWRTGKYLYVRAPKRELYDQSSDPGAVQNVASSAVAVADTLDSQLSSFLEKTSDAPKGAGKLDPAQMEKLRALGYMGSDMGNTRSAGANLIDPKDRIEVANRLGRDLVDMEEDRFDQAIADLRDMADHQSDVPQVYLELGQALNHVKRYQEAIPFLRTAASKAPDASSPYYQLGVAYVNLEQYRNALEAMQAAVVRNPNSPQYHLRVAYLQNQLLNLPEAEKEYKKTLELDPEYFEAHLEYGKMLALAGRINAALAQLAEAEKLRPESPEPHASLAEIYAQIGEEAKANRERALAQRLTENRAP